MADPPSSAVTRRLQSEKMQPSSRISSIIMVFLQQGGQNLDRKPRGSGSLSFQAALKKSFKNEISNLVKLSNFEALEKSSLHEGLKLNSPPRPCCQRARFMAGARVVGVKRGSLCSPHPPQPDDRAG